MEEEIQSGEKTDPTGLMAKYRKILLNKSFQYQQMMDMSDTLVENVNDFFDEKEVICFQTNASGIYAANTRITAAALG